MYVFDPSGELSKRQDERERRELIRVCVFSMTACGVLLVLAYAALTVGR